MLSKYTVKGKASHVVSARKDKVEKVTNKPDLEAEQLAEKLPEKIGKRQPLAGKAIVKTGKGLTGKR